MNIVMNFKLIKLITCNNRKGSNRVNKDIDNTDFFYIYWAKETVHIKLNNRLPQITINLIIYIYIGT